jgi:signal transduction histidine kinase
LLKEYVPFLAVILFSASVLVGFVGLYGHLHEERKESGNTLWNLVQLETDYLDFQHALDLYTHPQGSVSQADVHGRFELLVNRLAQFTEGEQAVQLHSNAGVPETVAGLEAALAAIEADIRRLSPDDDATYRAIRDRLAAFRQPIRAAARASLLAEADGTPLKLYDDRGSYALLALSLIGTLASGSFLIVLLVRHLRKANCAWAKARQAQREAEDANRAKSQFLANVSHDLRTPLNAIIGFSQMIELDVLGPLADSRYRDYGRDIRTSAQHLQSLIDDLLDLSKIELGRFTLREEIVDVADVVASSIYMIDDQAKAAGVTIRSRLPVDLPLLVADARALKQVILNLLSNGVKFTPNGGRVTVSVRLRYDGCMLFYVADTGIGIAERDLARVTAPFEQAHNARLRGHRGTGLGLSLCKRLVELQGGTMTITSQRGVGTTVAITFPAERVHRIALAA